MVEYVNEERIALAIYLCQFDADQLELAEHLGIEEKGTGVEGPQQLAVFLTNHRFQLIDIAHEQELLAAKGFAHVAAIDAEHLVDEVDDVCTYHRNLIDDDEFQFAENLALLSVVLQGFADVASVVACVVGQQRVEWQLEE